MARCNRCNRFLWLTPSTGYCDSCYEIVLRERERRRKVLEESRKKEEERKKQEEEEKQRAAEKAKQEEERKRQEENHRKKIEFDTLKYLPVITNHFNEILAQADGKSVRIAVGEDLLSATFMNYPLKALDGERFNVCSIFQIDKPSGESQSSCALMHEKNSCRSQCWLIFRICCLLSLNSKVESLIKQKKEHSLLQSMNWAKSIVEHTVAYLDMLCS